MDLAGFTDWHSHILPAVDDGVQSTDEALAILESCGRMGVKAVWLTPHIMEDIPNTTAGLTGRFNELKAAYTGSVELHLAAEYMLDNLFETRLAAGDLLTLGETGCHLLVETSYFNPPMNLFDMLEEIKRKGYYPVLAHPERYIYMHEDDYVRLKGMGVKFQVNLFSLFGAYGLHAAKKSEWLLKKGFNDMFGSDTHRIDDYRDGVAKRVGRDVLKMITDSNKITNI